VSELQEGQIEARGLVFPTFDAGPVDGPLVLCLNGFPDHARSWRLLLPALAGAGYRAVAPLLRGYAPSAQSADGNYQSAAVSRDVLAMIEALGREQAALVGHDWGAVAATEAAILGPERVSRLVALSVPHRTAGVAMMSQYDQIRRSFYVWFFQTPFAEAAVAAGDFAFLDRLWADWSPGYELAPAEREALKATFRQPGVLAAALAYYRATFDPAKQDPALAADQARAAAGEVEIESLYLHGDQDGCIGLEATLGMEAGFAKGFRKVVIEGAGHFLPLEAPDRVSHEILEFLGPAAGPPGPWAARS